MPKMAGLLEEMYSWHMDPFFQPKKSTNFSVEDPASAALVAAVLLNEWKVYLSHSGTLRNLATRYLVGHIRQLFLPHMLLFQQRIIGTSVPNSALVLVQLLVDLDPYCNRR
jgi:hypothetical protein